MNIYRIWDKINPVNIYHKLNWGISNIIHYFPEIWKQRDWDDSYIYTLLLRKMKRLQKRSIQWEKIFEDGDINRRDVNICVKLLEEIIADDSQKYVPKDCHPKNTFEKLPDATPERYSKMITTWPYEGAEQIWRDSYEKGEKRLEKIHKLFWKIMAERSGWWWD
jgi:hypothetical protein